MTLLLFLLLFHLLLHHHHYLLLLPMYVLKFFFTLRSDDLGHLDGKHTVFGEVAEGMDVLEALNLE
jgi:hypothetical protein